MNQAINDKDEIQISILSKSYTIKCEPEQSPALKQAAEHLAKMIEKIKASGQAIETERTLLIAALNLSYDLLQSQTVECHQAEEIEERLKRLQLKIETTLEETIA